MSTFKEQPVYAEMLFGWLDLCRIEELGVAMDEVMSTVDWQLKGGTLGAYDMRKPSDTSGTSYPNFRTADWPKLDDAAKVPLLEVLSIRAAERRGNTRSLSDWIFSYNRTRQAISASPQRRPARSGMAAIYALHAAAIDTFSGGKRTWALLHRYVTECCVAASAASFTDVPTVHKLWNRLSLTLADAGCAAMARALEELTQIRKDSVSGGALVHARTEGRQIMYDHLKCARPYKERSWGEIKVEVMHKSAIFHVGDAIYVLSWSDIVRLYQMMSGTFSGLVATLAQAACAPGADRKRLADLVAVYYRQIDIIRRAASVVKLGDEVLICKALRRAFTAYMGELAGPLCAPETEDLWAETRETCPGIDVDEWVANIRPLTATMAFNLGKLYKVCPAPDACPGMTMIDRHKTICDGNDADPEILNRFKDTYRAEMLRAYYTMPGATVTLRDERRVPPWMHALKSRDLDKVPIHEIHRFLRWEGAADMPPRFDIDPSNWTDAGLGWDNYDTAVDPDRVRWMSNMLTRMIFDPSSPMPGKRHTTTWHHHKVDTKPEGHKDPARSIFSGNLTDRLNQSWMEAAVSCVAMHHPAYMISSDVEDREKRVRAIVSRNRNGSEADLYYSFDISGWSARMPGSVQRISHALWGELYDEPLFRGAHTINEGATMYMNKAGYQGWFINNEANLEGYNAKEMTMVLITLMSLTVSRWREQVVEMGLATAEESAHWAALLLAYIDDGLAKITLPRDRAQALFAQFKKCTVETFKMCGFTIEVSKCFPSDRFAVFLNEPYIAGRHVVHGIRAAMTICAEDTEQQTTLLERVSAVSTSARGAIMSGLDALPGCILMYVHLFRQLHEWVPKWDPSLGALWSFAPRAWGGLGLPTLLQISTSGGGAAVEESVNTLQKWARVSNLARTFFLKMARANMVERTSTGVLLAPLGLRGSSGVMTESRVPDAVRDAMNDLKSRGRLSSCASRFLSYGSPVSLKDYSEAVIPLGDAVVLHEQIINDLAAAHPHAVFSQFARRIEQATTVRNIIGAPRLAALIKLNRADARDSFESLKLIVSS